MGITNSSTQARPLLVGKPFSTDNNNNGRSEQTSEAVQTASELLPTPPESDIEEVTDLGSVQDSLGKIGDELTRLSSKIEQTSLDEGEQSGEMVSKSFFSTRTTTFGDVKFDAQHRIEIKDFLEACTAFSELYDLLGGKVFTPLKGDITGNIVKVRNHAEKENINTLEELVQNELDKKTDKKAGSATDALLWLKRGLSLFCKFLTKIVEQREQADPGKTFYEAYDETLSKVHNFVVRKVVGTMVYGLPALDTLIMKLLTEHDPNDGPKEEVVLRHLEDYISTMTPVLDQLDAFYTSKGLKNWA